MSGALCALAGGGGGGASFITLTDGSASASGAGARTATYRLGSDGIVYHGANAVFTLSDTWCNSPGVPADYEARADVDTGSLSSGTTGSWLTMTVNRDWAVQDTLLDGSPATADIIVQIRNAATLVVLDSATITLTAERTS